MRVRECEGTSVLLGCNTGLGTLSKVWEKTLADELAFYELCLWWLIQ